MSSLSTVHCLPSNSSIVWRTCLVAIATPEDTIVSKLIWRRESQSDKQWWDILGILKVQQERLDFTALSRLVRYT